MERDSKKILHEERIEKRRREEYPFIRRADTVRNDKELQHKQATIGARHLNRPIVRKEKDHNGE